MTAGNVIHRFSLRFICQPSTNLTGFWDARLKRYSFLKVNVDNQRAVIAKMLPILKFTQFNRFNSRKPFLGNKNIVNVIGLIFIISEAERRATFFSLLFGKMMMIHAVKVKFFPQSFYQRRVIQCSAGVPDFITESK